MKPHAPPGTFLPPLLGFVLLTAWLPAAPPAAATPQAEKKPAAAATTEKLPQVVTGGRDKSLYIRCLQTAPDTFVKQTGRRIFKPGKGRGPEVELLGAIHVGEEGYYKELMKRMDAAEVVLFEGVSDEQHPADKLTPAQKARKEDSSAYKKFADLTGLILQHKGISYTRKHFERCDMSVQQMQALLEAEVAAGGEAAKDARKALREFARLQKILDGDSWLVNFAFWVAGLSDMIKAELKFSLVLGADQDKKEEEKAVPPRLSKLITEDRNAHVLQELQRVLKERPKVKRFLVFYGAAHLPGLEKGLTDMGYQAAGPIEWLGAVTCHPQADGLEAKEIKDEIEKAKKSDGSKKAG